MASIEFGDKLTTPDFEEFYKQISENKQKSKP